MKLNKNNNCRQAAVKSPGLFKTKNAAGTALLVAAVFCTMLTGCQKGDLLDNPNAASTSTVVPPSLILNRITNEFYDGGGVLDGEPGAYNEGPWNQVMRWNQYFVSNYPYYWGSNTYNWTTSATEYDMLKYVSLLQQQVQKQYGATPNAYNALAKFFQAYSFIWLTQRVGDIPMSQALNPTVYPTPKYDLQHDVYKNSLALLDTANTLMGAVTTSATANTVVDATGDIFGLTYLQWQKVINTYKLRVLISLSKKVTEPDPSAADLNIAQQFATIIANPAQYPIMTSNSDNLAQHYLSSPSANNYPLFPNYTPYIGYESMSKTFLDITTSTQDPRTFIAAAPAASQIQAGIPYTSFAAYVGADIGQSYTSLTSNVNNYSANNYLRYYGTAAGPNVSGSTCEPYIIIGYPEMCFNIAEAANLGWIPGGGASWYTAGIKASMSWLGLSDGATVTVGLPSPSNFTAVLGPVTVSVSNFLNNSAVVYAGDNANGRTQILTQKYVAFWQNSGWEAYYNWRRTGVPTFSQGGPNIGTPSLNIPLRWQYPVSEQTGNTTNYNSALTSQYGGADDITMPMWSIK